MKKTVSVILMLILVCTAVFGCQKGAKQQPEAATPIQSTVNENNAPDPSGNPALDPEAALPSAPYNASTSSSGANTMQNVSFVMIYNPFVYDENDSGTSARTNLNAGSFGSQIVTGLNRAGGLDDEPKDRVELVSPRDLMGDFDDSQVAYESGRGGAPDPVYEKNAKHSFYAGYDSTRYKREFTCVYEGSGCYIWSEGSAISEAQAEKMGKAFDETICPTDSTYFGKPRFTENGGKVNILFYPMMSNNICGFFHTLDIFSAAEMQGYSQEVLDYYGVNTDHAIININSKFLSVDEEIVLSTLAHELQHLICASDCFNYVDTPYMRTWLNESMSAYAEELNYPGIKVRNGYNEYFYLSDSFRKGQSLYDFENRNDPYIGEYGVVYLFAKYIEKFAGGDVYSGIHAYWRDSYSADITEASALYASVPGSFRSAIDAKYAYPKSVSDRFASREEEWMSKVTLDFYLETVSPELADLVPYANAMRLYMLYDEINPVSIEGGGRIIVATENGSFTVPEDAESGLIYIGFDKDFNVTATIYPNS